MQLKKGLLWLAVMLALGYAYGWVFKLGFYDVLAMYWLVALASVIVMYFVPSAVEDPEAVFMHWLVWAIVMAAFMAGYGWLLMSGPFALYTIGYWGFAAVSALVWYYVVPWGEKYLPA